MRKKSKGLKTLVVFMVLMVVVLSWSSQLLAQRKSIRILGWAGPRCEFTSKGMAEIFMKEHPDVRVVVEGAPYGEFLTKIALDIAAGGGTYDILWAFTPFDKHYVDAGYLQPLDRYLLRDPEFLADIRKDMYPNVIDLYNYNDRWYGIPADSNTQIFYYRKDVLAKAGVEVPTTWAEVLNVAPKVHNPPRMYALGTYLERYWATDAWLALFYSLGGEFWKEDYRPSLDSSAAVQATKNLLKFWEWGPEDQITWDEAKMHDAMGSAGILAMSPYCWAGPVLTDPKMAKFANDIDTAVSPSVEGNLVVPMGGLSLAITTKAGYPDEAWEFIRFYLDRENQRTIVALGGQPSRVSALLDPVNVARNPYFPAFAHSLPMAIKRTEAAEYERIAGLLGIELNNVILGRKTVERALADTNRAAYEIFAETGKIRR